MCVCVCVCVCVCKHFLFSGSLVGDKKIDNMEGKKIPFAIEIAYFSFYFSHPLFISFLHPCWNNFIFQTNIFGYSCE